MVEALLKCSFCTAMSSDVEKLIAGPGIHICDGCISRAQVALDEGRVAAPGARGTECAFCGKRAEDVDIVPASEVHVATTLAGSSLHSFDARTTKGAPVPAICAECVNLCAEILDASEH